MFKCLSRAIKWTGFDNDRFWLDFKIICFLVWVLLCLLLLCLSCKAKKLTLCAILWLCLFCDVVFQAHPTGQVTLQCFVIDGVLYIVTLYLSWCCVFATPYWPGHITYSVLSLMVVFILWCVFFVMLWFCHPLLARSLGSYIIQPEVGLREIGDLF